MRIVTYNILHGGVGRADPIAEVLLAQRPDVVGLVEADDLEVIERLSRRLNVDFIHALKRDESHAPRGCALLSRYPIAESINHASLHPIISRSFLEATLLLPNNTRLPVAVVHLYPRATDADESQRELEINQILKILTPHRQANRPHLLLGDFNAVSPNQHIDPAKLKPKTLQAWHANGGRLPRRVIEMVQSQGYLDTLQIARASQAQSESTFTTQHPGQRVDFIFTHSLPPQSIKDAWIEQDRLATYASDHYPAAADIELG